MDATTGATRMSDFIDKEEIIDMVCKKDMDKIRRDYVELKRRYDALWGYADKLFRMNQELLGDKFGR